VLDGWSDFNAVKTQEIENMIDLYGTGNAGNNNAPQILTQP
jgi:hypothetical protein